MIFTPVYIFINNRRAATFYTAFIFIWQMDKNRIHSQRQTRFSFYTVRSRVSKRWFFHEAKKKKNVEATNTNTIRHLYRAKRGELRWREKNTRRENQVYTRTQRSFSTAILIPWCFFFPRIFFPQISIIETPYTKINAIALPRNLIKTLTCTLIDVSPIKKFPSIDSSVANFVFLMLFFFTLFDFQLSLVLLKPILRYLFAVNVIRPPSSKPPLAIRGEFLKRD